VVRNITFSNLGERVGRVRDDFMAKKEKMSKRASAFIAREAKKQYKHGKSIKQAVAIAYSKARKKGFKIPQRRKR